MKRIGVLLLGIVLLSGCAGRGSKGHPLIQVGADQTVLGIMLDVKGPGGSGTFRPRTVWFARMAEGATALCGNVPWHTGCADPERVGSVQAFYRSNLVRGNTAYLIGAPPGRYVAVMARVTKKNAPDGTPIQLFLPAETVAQSDSVLATAETVFMGRHRVRGALYKGRGEDFGEVQAYYADTLDEFLGHGGSLVGRAISLAQSRKLERVKWGGTARGSDRSEQAEAAFLKAVEQHMVRE